VSTHPLAFFFAKNDICATIKSMNNKDIFTTTDSSQTRKMGEILAGELQGGEIICLTGELGSGKTTFAQGLLKGLGARGPYTSPTFVVIKEYKTKFSNKSKISKLIKQKKYKIPDTKYQILNIYHIDAYRVDAKDVLDLGWEEIISSKNNIVIVEWAERIKRIIPESAAWLKFEYLGDDERKIFLKFLFNLCQQKRN
jgi:tRNA threonylcarbamoyladenosine biosynthesis protein TsaE